MCATNKVKACSKRGVITIAEPSRKLSSAAKKIVKRQVKFAAQEANQVRMFDTTDRKSQWYSPIEYMKMTEDTTLTIMENAMVAGDARRMDPDEHTIRGIEVQIYPDLHHQRLSTLQHVIQSVLQCQLKCKLSGKDNSQTEECLFHASRAESWRSQHMAQTLASVDESAAALYQGSDAKPFR